MGGLQRGQRYKAGINGEGALGGPAPHQTPPYPAQLSLLRCTLLSSLLLCCIHETQQNSYCQQIITERHLEHLQDLVSAPMVPAGDWRPYKLQPRFRIPIVAPSSRAPAGT